MSALKERLKESREGRKGTTIKIYMRTKNALELMKQPGQTYDEVIVGMIQRFEARNNAKYLFP